jgi:hypothetical protein
MDNLRINDLFFYMFIVNSSIITMIYPLLPIFSEDIYGNFSLDFNLPLYVCARSFAHLVFLMSVVTYIMFQRIQYSHRKLVYIYMAFYTIGFPVMIVPSLSSLLLIIVDVVTLILTLAGILSCNLEFSFIEKSS